MPKLFLAAAATAFAVLFLLALAAMLALVFGPFFGLPDTLNIGWEYLFSGAGYQ